MELFLGLYLLGLVWSLACLLTTVQTSQFSKLNKRAAVTFVLFVFCLIPGVNLIIALFHTLAMTSKVNKNTKPLQHPAIAQSLTFYDECERRKKIRY